MKMFLYGALLACLATPAIAGMEPSLAAKMDMLDRWMEEQSRTHAARNKIPNDDYPYVRAYALAAGWNKFQLEDELRLARYHKAPQTAVYQDSKEFYGWRLLERLESEKFRQGLITLAAKKPRPYFGLPEQ